MTKEQERRVNAYMNITSPVTLVTQQGRRWKIETPEDDLFFDTLAELMENIDANLEAIRELVEAGQIERELWEEAWR